MAVEAGRRGESCRFSGALAGATIPFPVRHSVWCRVRSVMADIQYEDRALTAMRIELARVRAERDQLRATLEEEVLRIRLDPEVMDDRLDGREQGFSDMPTWKVVALEYQHTDAGFGERDRGRSPARAGAGDDHIPFPCL